MIIHATQISQKPNLIKKKKKIQFVIYILCSVLKTVNTTLQRCLNMNIIGMYELFIRVLEAGSNPSALTEGLWVDTEKTNATDFLMPTLWLVFSRQERFYSTNAGRLSLMPHQHRTWEETAVGVRPSGPMNRIITSFCESCTLWSTQLPDAHWMWPNQSGFKWE